MRRSTKRIKSWSFIAPTTFYKFQSNPPFFPLPATRHNTTPDTEQPQVKEHCIFQNIYASCILFVRCQTFPHIAHKSNGSHVNNYPSNGSTNTSVRANLATSAYLLDTQLRYPLMDQCHLEITHQCH
jgi:hypothetical protein